MSLGSDIVSCFGVDVTLRRRTAGSYLAGRFVEGPETLSTIKAVIQPAKPNQLIEVSEGRRTQADKSIVTKIELLTADAPNNIQPDRIDHKGETYEIHNVADWDDQGGFFKSLGLKVGQ